jgi:hypothetical protein
VSTTIPASPRSDAGFWSSAKSFFLPVGPHLDPAAVRGYPIDLRVKARSADAVPRDTGDFLHVASTQFALGCYEHWLATGREAWLSSALAVANDLIDEQDPDGSWYHRDPFPHTFELKPPWASGLVQGQAASLFVRLFLETGDARLGEAADNALAPLRRTQSDGGVLGDLNGEPWLEEYPTTPQSHVLNGEIFALWGVRDVAVGLGSDAQRRFYDAAAASLVSNLRRFDTGSWSLYALYPHPIRNRASSFYHALHINQLSAQQLLDPHPEVEATTLRWRRYAQSRRSRSAAFAWKAAFRILVPRNPIGARLTSWLR